MREKRRNHNFFDWNRRSEFWITLTLEWAILSGKHLMITLCLDFSMKISKHFWYLDPIAWEKYAIARDTLKKINQDTNQLYKITFDLSFIDCNSNESLIFAKIEEGQELFDTLHPNQLMKVLQEPFQTTANCNRKEKPSTTVGDFIPGSCDLPDSLWYFVCSKSTTSSWKGRCPQSNSSNLLRELIVEKKHQGPVNEIHCLSYGSGRIAWSLQKIPSRIQVIRFADRIDLSKRNERLINSIDLFHYFLERRTVKCFTYFGRMWARTSVNVNSNAKNKMFVVTVL
jgi:hypothetical protein